MAYQTGSATDINDLITKLKDFCVTVAGYTLNQFATQGAGYQLHINKGGRYFHFRSYVNENVPTGSNNQYAIFMNAGTGYAGTTNWYDEAGTLKYNTTTPYIAGMLNLNSAILAYHAFYFNNSDYDAVYFFVEYPAGSFQRLMFGRIGTNNYGSGWSGVNGMFYQGSVDQTQNNYSLALNLIGPSQAIWAPSQGIGALYGTVDSVTQWMVGKATIPQAQLSPARPYCTDSIYRQSSIWMDSPNSFNSMPPLLPISLGVTRDTLDFADNTPWSAVGELPYIYWINLKNINPSSIINISSDSYIVLPFRKKSDTWSSVDPNNGTFQFGIAIRTDI